MELKQKWQIIIYYQKLNIHLLELHAHLFIFLTLIGACEGSVVHSHYSSFFKLFPYLKHSLSCWLCVQVKFLLTNSSNLCASSENSRYFSSENSLKDKSDRAVS